MDKDTSKFSRESFKEKILRELEEGASPFARGQAEQEFEPLVPKKKPEKPERQAANLKIEPFKLLDEDFPQASQSASEEAVHENSPSVPEHSVTPEPEVASSPLHETMTLRERLEAMALEQEKLQAQPHFQAAEAETSQAQSKQQEAPAAPTTGQFSRSSRARRQAASEAEEEVIVSERKTSEHPPKRKASSNNKKSSAKATKTKKATKEKPKKKKATASKIIAVIVLILILLAGGTGWYGYTYIKAGVEPLDASNHTIKAINVPAGSSSKQIGNLLQKDGIIKNGTIFQYYTKFKNYTGFKSGYYNLSPDMSLDTIATALEKGGTPKPVEPTLGKITIPEGWTLDQIAQGITVNADEKNGKTPFTTDEFMRVVKDPTFIAKMQAKYPKLFASLPSTSSGVKYQLEGYLFPATYDYTKTSTTESIVESMISAMDTQLEPYYDQMASKNLSVNEVLSLAALVEKEANNDADRRAVAGVFFNRMNAGMTLDSNSSVLYAEGKLGAETTLKQDATIDTHLNSPYNLYANKGAGPGPIDSPSLSSIKAVLNPTASKDYYFVADVTTGKVYFAQTLAEQNQNVQTYVNDKLSK